MTDTPIAATEGGLLDALAGLKRLADRHRATRGDMLTYGRTDPEIAAAIEAVELATRTPSPCSLGEDVVERVARTIEIAVVEQTMHHPAAKHWAQLKWLWPYAARAALSALRPVQRTLREQIELDAKLVAALPPQEREAMRRELDSIFHNPGIVFERPVQEGDQ